MKLCTRFLRKYQVRKPERREVSRVTLDGDPCCECHCVSKDLGNRASKIGLEEEL